MAKLSVRFAPAAWLVVLCIASMTIAARATAPPLREYHRVPVGTRVPEVQLRRGLALDQRFHFLAALRHYRLMALAGHCRPKSRCHWHHLLSERLADAWAGRRGALSAKEVGALAVDLANKALAVRVDLGRVHPRLEREARYYYELAVLLDPQDASARIGIAALFAEQGNADQALRRLQPVLRSRLKALDYYNVAYVYAALRRPDQALVYLRRALSLQCKCGSWARQSDDFRHMRSDPRFRQLLLQYP